MFGGFSNSISYTAWREGPPENDQSASAFRKAGIVMMYPSLRGGNENPGHREGFFGEVDDVIAAGNYLAKQDGIDPDRIYLGGHSTGGTLVLLAAASTDRFRAVFSLGPAADVEGYGAANLPFDLSDGKEFELRAPKKWLSSIRCPAFVFEGTEPPSNVASLREMARTSRNPLVHFQPVEGASHFSVIAPLTRLIASKVLDDRGEASNLSFTEAELARIAGE
jgi:acetyl esterase/lipase